VRHPIRWILGGFLVVVVAVVGFGVWYVFGGKTPAKPSLSPTVTTTPGGPATPDGTWKVTPGTNVYVGYRIKELFADAVVKRDAVGRTPAVSGAMTIANGKVTTAAMTAQMQQLASNRGTRDNYIHTHGIESDKYPTSEFKLTQPIALPAELQKGQSVSVTALGLLTLHGVTRPVKVSLQARWDGATIEVVGSAPIVLADYHITPPDTGVVSVDDHGSFELSLRFARA
jgi:polyisoprenoid-binding protein YceI